MYRFPADGEYTFRLVTGGTRPAASAPIELALWIDGHQVQSGTLDPDASASFFTHKQDLGGKFVDVRVRVTAGEHWVAASIPRLFEGLPASYGGPHPSLEDGARRRSSRRRRTPRRRRSSGCASGSTSSRPRVGTRERRARGGHRDRRPVRAVHDAAC